MTTPSNNEYSSCEQNIPQLNVPAMINPILDNFDAHVQNFIRFLRDRLNCRLVYLGPENIREHILRKTIYACSVTVKPDSPKPKILRDVFPIMIGTRLDLAIRHKGIRSFEELPPFSSFPFEELDIGRGFFIINGFLRHVPYFYTNDPTNTHVVQKKIVRVYSYNAQDRGKELNYYVADMNGKHYGDVTVVHNDGSETLDDPEFFTHCPHPVNLTAYMKQTYRDNLFDIDHLGNKQVVSPGHLFTKLFVKYLYGPLRQGDWATVKSKTSLVCSSIETGYLLHVLSRKTVYFKEGKSAGKMTNEPQESYREIGANGEVFIEKNMGCYREISTQTYPLNPYLLYLIVRQMSNKVKHTSLEPFHSSYEGWFCKLGVFETKHVGRTNMMVRNTIVSTCDDLDQVYHETPSRDFWSVLNLEPQTDQYFVVVNEACIPVSRRSFFRIDLLTLKRRFVQIECYERGKFIVIRFKMGIIMKQLPGTDVWVTPYDQPYWVWRFFGDKSQLTTTTTTYLTDLNVFYHHNAFLKNILAFNALKNAILPTTSRYALYFMDTISAYRHAPSKVHKNLLEPVDDGMSKHFAIQIPHVVVTYMSFKGLTQEDCIVKRKDFSAFDCFRFYTLRFKLNAVTWVHFYPVCGDLDDQSDLLGTVISGDTLQVDPYSIHVRVQKISPCEYRIYFNKYPFRILQHFITDDKLMISVEQEHVSSTGDKLCSLHGQKGVIRVVDRVPTLDGTVVPDLIINPYCMFRMTVGQIREALRIGGGRDATTVHNSDGRLIQGAKAFYGRTFYFAVAYLSCEHMYAPEKCVTDRVLGQPVKGRSRGGGMKLGNMELYAMRGNGIASCFEEKFFEDGDRVPYEEMPTVALPKAVNLVIEEAKFFKCLLEYKCTPSITMDY